MVSFDDVTLIRDFFNLYWIEGYEFDEVTKRTIKFQYHGLKYNFYKSSRKYCWIVTVYDDRGKKNSQATYELREEDQFYKCMWDILDVDRFNLVMKVRDFLTDLQKDFNILISPVAHGWEIMDTMITSKSGVIEFNKTRFDSSLIRYKYCGVTVEDTRIPDYNNLDKTVREISLEILKLYNNYLLC